MELNFLLKKRTGDFNGWIGYTYSKTMRKFDAIDNGEWFPAKYDRRNDLSLVGQYQINDRVNIGAVFVYATGNAISLPERRWFSLEENRIITVWSKRNQYRLNPYHRLDISLTIDAKPFKEKLNAETNKIVKVKKKVISSWNFSVYNAYNRANPYFIFFDFSGDPLLGTAEFEQVKFLFSQYCQVLHGILNFD